MNASMTWFNPFWMCSWTLLWSDLIPSWTCFCTRSYIHSQAFNCLLNSSLNPSLTSIFSWIYPSCTSSWTSLFQLFFDRAGTVFVLPIDLYIHDALFTDTRPLMPSFVVPFSAEFILPEHIIDLFWCTLIPSERVYECFYEVI